MRLNTVSSCRQTANGQIRRDDLRRIASYMTVPMEAGADISLGRQV